MLAKTSSAHIPACEWNHHFEFCVIIQQLLSIFSFLILSFSNYMLDPKRIL